MTESLVGIWIAWSDTRRSLEDTSALQRDFNGWLVERFAQNEFQNHQNDVKVGLLLQRFCEFRGDLNQKRISEFFYFSTLVQSFSKLHKDCATLRYWIAHSRLEPAKIENWILDMLDRSHRSRDVWGGFWVQNHPPPEIDRIVWGDLPKRRCTQ